MAKFAINASGAMLLPSLVQVSESISGSVVPLAMFYWLLNIVVVQILQFLPQIAAVAPGTGTGSG